MRLYSNLVQRCFDDCANDFTTKSLTGKEASHRLRIMLFELFMLTCTGLF